MSASDLACVAITQLHGVGGKFANTLGKLGIESVQDLLFHLPLRYLDRTRVCPIGALQPNSSVVVEGTVVSSQVVFGRRRSLVVKLEDNTGMMCLRFYHFNAAQKNAFETGQQVRCYSDVRPGPSGLEFFHPEYELLGGDQRPSEHEQSLTPVYGLTEGVSQARLRKLTHAALEFLRNHPPLELLPTSASENFTELSLSEALRIVHFPPKNSDFQALLDGRHPAQKRLSLEELLAHFLARQQLRVDAQSYQAAAINTHHSQVERFIDDLPFTPTAAQIRVHKEITKDLVAPKPMLRMVQGDVGSGKTLVAALSTLCVALDGYQVAIAAPTEILAAQHLSSFKDWLEPYNITVGGLSGSQTAAQKRDSLAGLSSGKTQVVVGTHALFQERVSFLNLALVIIDEQHRFGVDQRLSLRNKSQANFLPHQLVMTATPIPRTLAMTQYAELDFSIIDELPPGRIPINTAVVSQKRFETVCERILLACKEGRQAYWVCPLIEESETLDLANAEQRFSELSERLKGLRTGLVHGRLKNAEKDLIMTAFKAGELDMLVATTVIEVGVDVPNATMMVIENPERLGLAQLHQLRGRVGRGSEASYCLLLYGDKLSKRGRERLTTLRESTDGFYIAEKDLEMRGAGEFLGTRQAGDMAFRIADCERDADLLETVHREGKRLLQEEPQMSLELVQRWFGKKKLYAHA